MVNSISPESLEGPRNSLAYVDSRIEEIHAGIARDAHKFFQGLEPETLTFPHGNGNLELIEFLYQKLIDKIARNDGLEVEEAEFKLRAFFHNGNFLSGFKAIQRALRHLTPFFAPRSIPPHPTRTVADGENQTEVGGIYYEYKRFMGSMGDVVGYRLMDYTATLLQYHRENSEDSKIQAETKRGVNLAMSVFENTLLYYTMPHAEKLWELTKLRKEVTDRDLERSVEKAVQEVQIG